MKKIVILLGCILLLTLTSCSHKAKTKNDDVYISTSPRAYAYHEDGKCKWLVRTTYPIKKISRSKAEEDGRRPCHGCSD